MYLIWPATLETKEENEYVEDFLLKYGDFYLYY